MNYLFNTFFSDCTIGAAALAIAITITITITISWIALRTPKVDHADEFVALVESAHKRDEEMKALLEISTAGYWIWDMKTGHDFLSKSWCNLLGYKQSQLKHHVDTWTSLMHPEDLPRAKAALDAHIKSLGKTPYKLQARYKHRDGHWVTLLDNGKVIQWGNCNEPLRMVGFETKVAGNV